MVNLTNSNLTSLNNSKSFGGPSCFSVCVMERFDRSKLPDFCFTPEMTDPCLERALLAAAERLLYIIAKGRHPDEEFSSTEAVDILCSDFPKRKCQASWSKPTLTVHCETCALGPTSCVCFNCFLGGNHEGHRVFVHYSHAGYCDCGDETLWNPSGFCEDHTTSSEGCEMGDGTEKEIEILKFFCYSLLKMLWDRFETGLRISTGVLSALSKFISIGDLPRRCCALELGHMNIVRLLSRVVFLDEWVSDRLLDFLGHMASDKHFRLECAKQVVPNYPDIIRDCVKMVGLLADHLQNVKTVKILKKNHDFLFHAFQTSVLNSLLDNGLDWFDVVTKSLDQLLVHNNEIGVWVLYPLSNMSTHLRRIVKLAECGLGRADYETKNKFFEYFIRFCNKIEQTTIVSRELGDKRDDSRLYGSMYDFQLSLFTLPEEDYENLSLEVWKLADTDIDVMAFYHDDIDHDNILEGQPFPAIVPSSVLAAILLSSNFSKCEELFQVQENRDLIPSLVRLPLRLFAACCLATCGFFVRNPDSLEVHFMTMYRNRGKQKSHYLLFILIQLGFGYCDDVSYLIERMMVCFGLESRGLDRDQKSDVINLFLHYLNCLIFDRVCCSRDLFAVSRLNVINRLKVKPVQAAALYDPQQLTDRLLDDLRSFATQTTVNGTCYFTLTDDSEWHCLLPMTNYYSVKVIISEFMKKNPDSLVRFPSFEPEKYGLKLGRILHDYIVLALIYEYLSDFLTHGDDSVIRPIHVQYLLNMIVQAYNISEDKTFVKGNSEPWIVETRTMLVSKMRDVNMKYNEFMYQPIGLGRRQIRTLYELLVALGPLGLSVLERMSIEIPPGSKDMESLKQARKEKVARLRQEIRESFAKQAQAILPFESDVQDENTVCSVCNEGSGEQVLCYPGVMFRSILLSTVRCALRPEWFFYPELGPSISICLHLLHPGCIEDSNSFSCPIDRTMKNCLLPYLPAGFSKPPPAAGSVISAFMETAFENDFSVAVACLRSELALLEIRQRAIEDAADDMRSKTLIRNLFFTILHWNGRKELWEDSGTMMRLLQWMLTQPTISESAVKSMVNKHCEKWFLLKMRTPYRVHSFLRRATLLIHCVFHDITKSENWDDLLALRNLFAYYGIEREVPDNLELPVFKFCRLPKNFFDFAKEPYAVDMCHPEKLYLCLLTGVILSDTAPRTDGNHDVIDKVRPFSTIPIDEAPGTTCATFAPLISLSGRDAGECFCQSYEWDLRAPLQPLYVDRFGECHPGFRRQELLTLKSEEAIINLADVILSHRWADIIG